jgi:pimeloyl-ACP methyl ester carboxylesterase
VRRVPRKLISTEQLDVRSVEQIIAQAGYPYEKHLVTTEDGYILTLERIPNPESKHVLYLQHGIFDSSFAWVGNNTGALAFYAHDQGYDVFLGNFRGNGDRLHVRRDIRPEEYWDFSINEHAFLDIPAFIESINNTKKEGAPQGRPGDPIQTEHYIT